MRKKNEISGSRGTGSGTTRVLAVTSGKGGVGKTNIAANLAVALAMYGRDVMLLDADFGLANVDVLLGLQPRYNLTHVVNGESDIDRATILGPAGIRVVPATSGDVEMIDLPRVSQASIIHSFGEIASPPEVLIVDTAAGISESVGRFTQAAQTAFVVVCDEPASITDAYALIKVFSREHGISRFQIVTNMTRSEADGRHLFYKLSRVADQFLDVVLRHAGNIPLDAYLKRAVQEQRAVVEAYPESWSARAFRNLATKAATLRDKRVSAGGIEFFLEQVFRETSDYAGEVA